MFLKIIPVGLTSFLHTCIFQLSQPDTLAQLKSLTLKFSAGFLPHLVTFRLGKHSLRNWFGGWHPRSTEFRSWAGGNLPGRSSLWRKPPTYQQPRSHCYSGTFFCNVCVLFLFVSLGSIFAGTQEKMSAQQFNSLSDSLPPSTCSIA